MTSKIFEGDKNPHHKIFFERYKSPVQTATFASKKTSIMDTIKAHRYIIAALIVFIGMTMVCSYRRDKAVVNHPILPEPIPIHDTTFVTDTVFIPAPIPIMERDIETITIPVTELQIIHDTVYLPRTQKQYEFEQARIYVSGYQPQLDSFYVYPTTTIITKKIPARRWGIGLSAGYGISGDGFSPYIGAGVYYRLF